MRRAGELFVIDERRSDSGFVAKVWATRSQPESEFISVAESHWQIVLTTVGESTRVTVQGPMTRASVTPLPQDAAFFGIVMNLGTFMPSLPLNHLADRAVDLPSAGRNGAWLDGTRVEIPTLDDADAFVERLVGAGLLVRDRVVGVSLKSSIDGLSARTLQRRMGRATGLTRGTIRQIARAKKAVVELGRGGEPLEVAELLGYSDQAHLNRSLKRFVGRTPGQLVNNTEHWSASSPLEPTLVP